MQTNRPLHRPLLSNINSGVNIFSHELPAGTVCLVGDLGVNDNKCLFSERLGLPSPLHVCCWIYLTLIQFSAGLIKKG